MLAPLPRAVIPAPALLQAVGHVQPEPPLPSDKPGEAGDGHWGQLRVPGEWSLSPPALMLEAGRRSRYHPGVCCRKAGNPHL